MTSDKCRADGVAQSDSATTLLVIADPGAPAALVDRICDSLAADLAGPGEGSAPWLVSTRAQPYLPDEQAPIVEVIESVDPADEDAELVVYITDLPRRDHTMPIVAEISPRHRFALVSIPGIGAVFVGRRLRQLLLVVIGEITQHAELIKTLGRLLREEVRAEHHNEIHVGVRYLAPRGLRRLRLLAGMVRANRPWLLATGLSKVLVAAFATGALGLATDNIWLMADTMGPWRLGTCTVLSISAMVAWLIIDHELWERPRSAAERDRARLYNAATLVTVGIGVSVMHLALFALLLSATTVTLPPALLQRTLDHPAGLADYLQLAWLLASIATIGGALGSGLEDDEVVKAAAYGVRQRQRFSKHTTTT